MIDSYFKYSNNRISSPSNTFTLISSSLYYSILGNIFPESCAAVSLCGYNHVTLLLHFGYIINVRWLNRQTERFSSVTCNIYTPNCPVLCFFYFRVFYAAHFGLRSLVKAYIGRGFGANKRGDYIPTSWLLDMRCKGYGYKTSLKTWKQGQAMHGGIQGGKYPLSRNNSESKTLHCRRSFLLYAPITELVQCMVCRRRQHWKMQSGVHQSALQGGVNTGSLISE